MLLFSTRFLLIHICALVTMRLQIKQWVIRLAGGYTTLPRTSKSGNQPGEGWIVTIPLLDQWLATIEKPLCPMVAGLKIIEKPVCSTKTAMVEQLSDWKLKKKLERKF